MEAHARGRLACVGSFAAMVYSRAHGFPAGYRMGRTDFDVDIHVAADQSHGAVPPERIVPLTVSDLREMFPEAYDIRLVSKRSSHATLQHYDVLGRRKRRRVDIGGRDPESNLIRDPSIWAGFFSDEAMIYMDGAQFDSNPLHPMRFHEAMSYSKSLQKALDERYAAPLGDGFDTLRRRNASSQFDLENEARICLAEVFAALLPGPQRDRDQYFESYKVLIWLTAADDRPVVVNFLLCTDPVYATVSRFDLSTSKLWFTTVPPVPSFRGLDEKALHLTGFHFGTDCEDKIHERPDVLRNRLMRLKEDLRVGITRPTTTSLATMDDHVQVSDIARALSPTYDARHSILQRFILRVSKYEAKGFRLSTGKPSEYLWGYLARLILRKNDAEHIGKNHIPVL